MRIKEIFKDTDSLILLSYKMLKCIKSNATKRFAQPYN